jgi:hypothetical protein
LSGAFCAIAGARSAGATASVAAPAAPDSSVRRLIGSIKRFDIDLLPLSFLFVAYVAREASGCLQAPTVACYNLADKILCTIFRTRRKFKNYNSGYHCMTL